MSTEYSATIAEILASTEEQTGVSWSLQERRDLNVNLFQFPVGEGAGEHVNDEVDVLFVACRGLGRCA
jgi:hypothetical protein